MPIGVPLVLAATDPDAEPTWVDIYSRLYSERLLFISQELTDSYTNQLISVLVFLHSEDLAKQLSCFINSPGGSVVCGISIYDCINFLNIDLTTFCLGSAASMASFVLASGKFGKRFAYPNARIMIHQPEGGSYGQSSELVVESNEVNRIRQQVVSIYAQRTGQSFAQISRDMDRDEFMSAEQAKDYGLIDKVIAQDFDLMTQLGLTNR